MEHILYIDASNGVSGDMLLSAFIDLGFPKEKLFALIKELNLPKKTISIQKVKRGIYEATLLKYYSNFKLKSFEELNKFINESFLSNETKIKALNIIKFLFQKEAAVHKENIKELLIEELRDVDFVIEICGVLKAIEYFSPSKIYCSPINIGFGQVKSHHGNLLIPSPLTSQLLKGIPIFTNGINYELTTPTGALLIKYIVNEFGGFPPSFLKKIGYGAGTYEIKNYPNIIRIFLCELPKGNMEKVNILETNIDNISGEILGYLVERLLAEGAYDVYYEPIFMKKNRPAYKLTILSPLELMNKLAEVIFRESNTIGVRFWQCDRIKLQRKTAKVLTSLGEIKVKIAYLDNQVITISPEYEDCKEIAIKHKLPIKEIYQIALKEVKKTGRGNEKD